MKSFVALLVLAAVALAEPEADAQYFYGNPYFADAHTSLGLTAYPNGAVVPTDTLSVQAAKAQHFAAKAAVAPFGYGYYGAGYLGGAHYIGKREAEADAQYLYAGYPYAYANPHTSIGLTAYANGAVAPTKTLAVQQAEAEHFAAKAAAYPYGYAGLYGGAHYIGKREAEAEPQYIYGSPYAFANPHTSIGLTAHPNGAITPTETLAVQQATIQHYAAKANAYAAHPYGYGLYGAAHYIGKREAEAEPEAQYLYAGAYGYPYATNYANYGFVNNYAYGAARYPYAAAYLG